MLLCHIINELRSGMVLDGEDFFLARLTLETRLLPDGNLSYLTEVVNQDGLLWQAKHSLYGVSQQKNKGKSPQPQ